MFRPSNDSRSLKDDLAGIGLLRFSAVKEKSHHQNELQMGELCVLYFNPPHTHALALPKVSCQLINHLSPVLGAKKNITPNFDFKDNDAEHTGVGASDGTTWITCRKDPTP